MKQYYFKDKQSYNLSEYEAFIKRDNADEFVSPKKYDYLRTREYVIYRTNKKTRSKQSIKIRRALALISKNEECLVKYDEENNIAFTKGNTYIFADRVQNEKEYDYHLSKFEGGKNPVVISLIKTYLCNYVQLDNKTIYDYYKKEFIFPKWFRSYLKMRAFRAYSSRGFDFNSRRYNDTKWTAEDKFKHDFVKSGSDIFKVYFTLARVLDSKLDSCGKGYPISGLMYLALDIDGKCDGLHLINSNGICTKCLADSNKKLVKVLKIVDGIPNIKLVKRLFSGSKGWHLHLEYNGKREVSEEILRNIIKTVNKEEELVDYFDGKEIDGVREFDLYRIFKIPGSCSADTACLVSEDIQRLGVEDVIIENGKS